MDLAPDRLRTFAAAAQTLNFTQATKQANLIPGYFTGFTIANGMSISSRQCGGQGFKAPGLIRY